ncbi:MAG: MFS transporter [Lachnospiraceae bacterium]|jgi:fucose permease|nr:MFS transporter [Lachnospiraceae bacterium]
MFSMLLVIIYLAFISLGLPDSLLGSAWPVMHGDLRVAQSCAGIVTMIISGGTICSSLLSDRLTHRFGAGKVTAVSVLLTAAALFGFSVSGSFPLLCVWAVPYGLGAGAIDAALNNYVALHFSSRHMSWLHCCWGIGASVSPYIMSYALTGGLGWRGGYRIVSIIQLVLTVCIFLSLPLWTRSSTPAGADASPASPASSASHSSPASPASAPFANAEVSPAAAAAAPAYTDGPIPLSKVIRIRGAVYVFLMFFAYCVLESTCLLWTSSYAVSVHSVNVETAARFAALYTLGITLGRFVSGFISNRLGDRKMILYGSLAALAGILLLTFPIKGTLSLILGMSLAGFGCGPIYPSIIHSTPDNFGARNSQAVIGMQMASAYIGSTFMPPLFGLLSSVTGLRLFPLWLLLFWLLMSFMFYRLCRSVGKVR